MKNLTKIAARKKITTHLKRRGHVADFKVTPVLVMRWWNLLNKAVFDDKLLPPRRIVVRAFREEWGWCQPMSKKGHVILGIHSEFMDRKQFIETLAHEMVHQWQWTFTGTMTHGKTFREWAPILKKTLDLPLEV
jgi:hypothetical protein